MRQVLFFDQLRLELVSWLVLYMPLTYSSCVFTSAFTSNSKLPCRTLPDVALTWLLDRRSRH